MSWSRKNRSHLYINAIECSMPRPCSARRVVKLQTQAKLGQIVWSMEADILLSELFVLNTQILGIYIWLWKKLGLLTKSYQSDTRDTRGEVMFPLHVGIIIKMNNQMIKIDIRIFTIISCRSVQAWRTSVVLNNWETNLVTLEPRSVNFQLAMRAFEGKVQITSPNHAYPKRTLGPSVIYSMPTRLPNFEKGMTVRTKRWRYISKTFPTTTTKKNYGFVEKTVAVWTFFCGGRCLHCVHVLMIQVTIKPNQTVCPFKKYVTYKNHICS